jgi:anthranilate synthase/aminodeoxychorismate synthase-like glutamine amidotransferase
MFLLIDNYDSFTYNIVHYLAEINIEVMVRRNDKISINEIEQLAPQAIFISPGPCNPDKAGICLELIKNFAHKYPIFGVCLGHQAIAQSFGAKIIKGSEPVHGKISAITHYPLQNQQTLFNNIPNPFNATRYHSLIIEEQSLDPDFFISARTNDNIIMAIEHKNLPIAGVQFHPESIGTEYGKIIFKNFIKKYC